LLPPRLRPLISSEVASVAAWSTMLSFSSSTLRRALLLASFVQIALSQTILPTTPSAQFPACALACAPLQNAASSCLPPQAPVTNQAIYNSCFCQSSILAPFYNSPNGVCDTQCAAQSDLDAIQAWYKSYCSAGGTSSTTSTTSTTSTSQTSTTLTTSPTPVILTTITAAGPSTSSTTTSSSSAAAVTSVISVSSADAPNQAQKGWWSNHWRWVLMIIVILIGLILLAVIAVYLKRRHRRKLEERRAAASGFPASTGGVIRGPDMWGPHQIMAHTNGWEYTPETRAGPSNLGDSNSRDKPNRRTSNKLSNNMSSSHPNNQPSRQPSNMSGAAAAAAMGSRSGSKHSKVRKEVGMTEKDDLPRPTRSSSRRYNEKDIEKI